MMDEETSTMKQLSVMLSSDDMQHYLAGMAHGLRHQLSVFPEERSIQSPVPLSFYGGGLPADIKSSWVFVLRANLSHPAERHPNSVQRMFSLDSDGAMDVWQDGAWQHRTLAAGVNVAGLSIPPLEWHRPVFLDHDWAVISFHTAASDELIEQLGDPSTDQTSEQRHYTSIRE